MFQYSRNVMHLMQRRSPEAIVSLHSFVPLSLTSHFFLCFSLNLCVDRGLLHLILAEILAVALEQKPFLAPQHVSYYCMLRSRFGTHLAQRGNYFKNCHRCTNGFEKCYI